MVDAIIQQARIDLPMFRFGTILGMGGFGEVLQGTHIRSGIKCAVKVIPATDNPDDRKMVSFHCHPSTDTLSLA